MKLTSSTVEFNERMSKDIDGSYVASPRTASLVKGGYINLRVELSGDEDEATLSKLMSKIRKLII